MPKKKTRSIFICFTGIDGAGKTTLSKRLSKTMADYGIKNKYVYNRIAPFLLKPLISLGRVFLRHGKDMPGNYDEFAKSKKRLFRNRLISSAYQYALLMEYLFQAFFKVKLPLMLGRNIVCDRYIYDTIITDLAADLHYSKKQVDNLLEKYFRILPEPDLVFLIDVPEEIAFQRKNDTPSVGYLKERREFYLHLGENNKVIILDGSKDPAELECIIWDRALEKVAPGEREISN